MALSKSLKLAFRNLKKNKVVSLLNIVGLTVGLTTSMLIFSFVMKEKSTDRFISEVDNIYCVTNGDDSGVHLSQNMANLIKEEIPEVDKITYCSVDWSPQVFLKEGQQKFKLERLLTADSCFFRVFPFEAVWGDPVEGLNTSNKLVITQSLSRKLFGDENPVGKTVTYDATYLQGEELEVTAVIKDLPQESSWNFEAVLSFQTNYKIGWYVSNMKHWGSQNYQGFARLNNHASYEGVLAKLKTIPLDKVPADMKEDIKFGLFPFSDVYFDLHELRFLRHGNRLTLAIIGITGLLVLLLACINYVNMVTAQREKWNKNIGIFKMMGSSFSKIVQLVTAESLIQLGLAVGLSLLLTAVILPVFNSLTSSSYSLAGFISLRYILLLLAVVALMLVSTGLLPGVLLSRRVPSFLLRKQEEKRSRSFSRNGLLVFQFVVTIALMTSIVTIRKQSQHLEDQDLGFDKESIIYANLNDALYEHIEAFKSELAQIPEVTDYTFSESVLVDNAQNWGRRMEKDGETSEVNFSKLSVVPNFFEFFGIDILEGSGFNQNSNGKKEFIFNQTAKRAFQIETIETAKMASSKPEHGRIVGIVSDFNFESLHVPVRAAGYMCSQDCDEVLYLKMNAPTSANFDQAIDRVKMAWNRFSPDFPMEYQFLDQKWESLYQKDRQFQKILSYTTIISLLLSCLGLVGLTYFVMEQRTKEIGIRKVNGAKVSEILSMPNKDFVKWVAIAFVLACPIAYYAMNEWLENFAYKTTLSWWVFALAGLLALGIALLTVSFQSWKAATRNPVEALRYE